MDGGTAAFTSARVSDEYALSDWVVVSRTTTQLLDWSDREHPDRARHRAGQGMDHRDLDSTSRI